MIDKDVMIKELGLKKATLDGNELKACCPNPQHEDHKPSWSFNLESQFYNCWSCGFGGKGVAGLYLKLGKNIPQWALADDIAEKKGAHVPKVRVKKEEVAVSVRTKWLEWLSANPKAAFKILGPRDITLETIEKFGIGFNKMYEVLYFPVMDSSGKLKAWAERSDKWEQRWLLKPAGVSRDKLLFGEQFIEEGKKNTIYLVEGPVDALKLWQWGYPAVATLFANLMPGQAKKLIDLADEVIFVPDNDKGGLKMIYQVTEKLKNKVKLFGVNLPDGIKDTGQKECTREVFEECLKNKIKIK